MPQNCKLRRDVVVDDVLYYYTYYSVTAGTTIVIQNSVTDEVFRWFSANIKPKLPMRFKPEFIKSVIKTHYEDDRNVSRTN